MKRAMASAAAVCALLAAGCSVGPKYKVPATPVAPTWKEPLPESYKESKGWNPADPADTHLRADWWTVFNDPELNALQEQIDVNNQNLKVAEARFQQARALIKLNRASLYPTVNVDPGITAGRTAFAKTLPGRSSRYTDFVLPVDIGYELDAWGRIRHSIEAAREEAQATAADLETVRLSLHSELAFDYFEMRSAEAQRKLLDDTVETYRKALDLTRNRLAGGVAAGAEVAQAETQLQSTETQATDVGVQRAQFEHAIAVLVGKPPAAFSSSLKPLAQEPPTVPVALPSELLQRRPDIAAAERRVAEANARIGIARAAFFPSIFLTATAGLQSGSILDWFSWPNRLWAVGPSVVQTVFDGGRRRANEQAVTADYDALVASYRETSLEAFQQVEDNLAALRLLEEETKTQQAAVQSAQRSLQLSMNRYTGGLVTYLEVLTAQTIALQNERIAVDIQRRRMDSTVLLIKALGGGWDTAKLPVMTK
jgi:NodT family efflux transporter outer membrane factor (OMF) lipoprotein